MKLQERFIEQRVAFEKTYEDDDWSRLDPFFDKDLRYEVMGMPFHCSIDGRQSVWVGMKQSLDGFDRKCVRKIGRVSALMVEGNNVLSHAGISFQRGDDPAISTVLWEIATYRNGLIVRLMDIYDAGENEKYRHWADQWGADLDASYV